MNKPLLKTLWFLVLLSFSLSHYAINSQHVEKQAKTAIKRLYHSLSKNPNASMTERVDWISKQFMGVPYVLGSLGEGPHAYYDQYPRYRVDGFDCETYVTTVLSLATADSFPTFQRCLRFTRYNNGKISYLNRNHFASIDWNKNNQERGLLKDITLDIVDKNKQPVAQFATALINKPSWYAHKTMTTIRLTTPNKEEEKKRLAQLKHRGSREKITFSKMPYIPLTALFSNDNEPNHYLFSQIPNGAIIEIVRPNWDLRQAIGTALNVSHLGFAFWVNQQLYFREASSQYGKVVEVPLIDYLKEAQKSPTIKGINIQILLPKKPIQRCDQIIH